MSDPQSNSGDDFSRFDPLPNTMGGADVGDVGDTSASLGTGRSGAAGSADSGAGTMDRAKDAVSGAQQKVGEMTDQASAKASQIGDQATQKADLSKEKAASGLDSLAHTLRDRSQSMGDGQIGQMATMAADRLEQGAEMLRSRDTDQLVMDLEELIRRRPLESLLVAAGAGYLLSRAL